MRKNSRFYWAAVVLLVITNVYIWAKPVALISEPGALEYWPQFTWSFESHPKLPHPLRGSGEGKTKLLYRAYRAVHHHPYEPRDQIGPSCVGHSTATALDLLGAIEHPVPLPPANGAWLYGASREFGGMSPMSGGSHARLAVRAANEVGFLYNENFIFEGYDLTTERYELPWRTGVPPELDRYAVNYISGYFALRNYEDVRDAIYNNMPVVVGSSVGFGRNNGNLYRDEDGFLTTPFFRFRGKYWLHAMCIAGVCDTGREGCLIINSWGDSWVKGGQRFGDEPAGSFWVDAATVDKMCAHGDCFAIWGLRRIE